MEFKPTKKQREAIRNMKCGKNVFLTGPAGTGKSYVLKYYINWFKENKENENNQIYITSTTGLSALLIDGMTIHRYAGIGIIDKDIEKDYNKINKMKSLKNRWKNTRVLIIDEISMMNGDIFDKLEFLARKIRMNDKPFGGIQLILSGDFLQIPPVKSDYYCFEASKWNIIDKTFYFDEILRQNNDILQSVLNNIRLGIITNDVKNLLDSCLNKELNPNNGEPTLLFSKKNMVVEYNQKKLNDLIESGKENYIYEASYQFNNNNVSNHNLYKDMLNNQFQVEDKLHFALNSQVMLTLNMPEINLANGSRGIIIDFTKDLEHYPIVLFDDGKVIKIIPNNYTIEEEKLIITKIQLPLILSWAITIHKAQGMTLDYIKTDIGNSIFEYGQAYVVLSRIKNIEGLSLINIDYSKIKAHPKILKYYENLK
jgi:ATP-dependent DNA helicase PIF1